MKLCISGTPGTGKTVISEGLAKRIDWKLININDLAEKLNAYLGEDEERQAKILDMKKIYDHLKGMDEDVIIEGHVAHEIRCDEVIILRCNPEVLEKRLKKRYPDKPEKVEENVDAEILGVITTEAVRCQGEVFEVDTSKKIVEELVDEIQTILDGKTLEHEVGRIDWLEEYGDRLVG